MSTLRISNIEAKSVPASATIDEKVKITNSSGDPLVFIDGKTSGITTVGINTTDSNITFDANSNIVVTGIITATRFSGQITPTSLEIGSNIKLGNAGVITATSFVGSGANLTSLPAQVTISNNANNRVITGGSGTNLVGEANLTFDGSQLVVQGGSGTQHMFRHSAGWGGVTSAGSAGGSGAGFSLANNYNGTLETKWSIYLDGSNDGLRFTANTPDQTSDEKMRLTSTGELGVNTTAPVEKLGISGNMRFVNPNGNTSRITALPSGTYNTGVSGGSAICFQRIADGGGGSDEIFFETHWQGNRHGESCRINKYGNLAFPSGNGIDFSADGNNSGMSSELLDDYEEGSFTPYIRTNNNATEPNYSHRLGLYTKVGNLVTWVVRITTSGELSTGSGATELWGLPFTARPWSTGDWPGGAHIAYYNNLRGNYGTNPRLLGPFRSSTFLRFHTFNAQYDTSNNLYNHIFTNNTIMIMNGHYYTDA